MSAALRDTWGALSASPLLWLTVTLLIYQGTVWLFERLGRRALLNPVLISIVAIIPILLVAKVPYATYFDGARMIHFLLGPATVALAVPLYHQLPALRRSWPAVLASVSAGAVTALVTAVLISRGLGGDRLIQLCLAPKSVTTPIAMGIAEQIGGTPSLTAVLVVLTGVTGGVVGTLVLDQARVRDPAARGLALGIAAHAIGTTRAFQDGETQGAFAGLAIGLTGLVTALATPLLIGWLASP